LASIGTNDYVYDLSGQDYGVLPDGWEYKETGGVAVDSNDNVYVYNRSDHPIIVLDRDGNFLRSWGEDMFKTPHGAATGVDDSVFLIDAGDHTVRKFSLEGKLLMTLGEAGKPSGRLRGDPFHGPTHVAVHPGNGHVYVSDGYSNARVHEFTPDGGLVKSWGRSGTDPGEFNTVHNIAIDTDGWLYVADRENHRVQVFDSNGRFETQWGNMAMASCLCMDQTDPVLYVGEFFAGIAQNASGVGNWTGKRLGPRVTVMSTSGEVLARVGDQPTGPEPGRFYAPHGIAVDSRGDLYVGDVSVSAYGIPQGITGSLRSFQKLVRRR
jgi:outer membrane protein assembly factor BamB